MPDPTVAERTLPWVLRALWVVVLLAGGRATDQALAASGSATLVGWVGLVGWVAGVAAMAIPSVKSLTATRAVVPVALPLAVATWIGGADPVDGALFVGAAALTAVVALSSTVGRVFVQASAYGDEDRHLLRPPLAFAMVAVGLWVVWAALIVTTAVAATSEAVAVAAIGGALSVVSGALLLPRWHRLSRRWLVLVPAGLVVHDHIALAETLMVHRRTVAGVGLALADTDAADLTGGTPGHAVEVRTTESITVLLGAAAGARAGLALHLTGFLVAPTRPGRALAAATRRRLPVGAPA